MNASSSSTVLTPDFHTLSTGVGALLVGNLFAAAVWGISSFQTYTYFNVPAPAVDSTAMRILVLFLWVLDTVHITFASEAVYFYLIVNYNNPAGLANIQWSLALSIGVTAVITFFVHCFFAWRIYLLSRGNRWLPVLIVILATVRMGFGFGSTVQCFRLKTFDNFSRVVRWLFTTGLTMAVVSDSIITGACCYYLSKNRSGFARMDVIIKTLQRYLIQSGALTTAITAVSTLCAAIMPHNMIWIGAHFVISKLYTASLVAALNSRDALREAHLNPENPTQPLELSGLKIAVATTREVDDASDNGKQSRHPELGHHPYAKQSEAFYFGPHSRASVRGFPNMYPPPNPNYTPASSI